MLCHLFSLPVPSILAALCGIPGDSERVGHTVTLKYTFGGICTKLRVMLLAGCHDNLQTVEGMGPHSDLSLH